MTRQVTISHAKAKSEGKESVCLLVDTSGSMSAMFGPMPRLQAAQNAAKRHALCSSPRATILSLMSFSYSTHLHIPPTTNFVEFQFLPPLNTESSTEMGRGILDAMELGPNRIILLSDGQPNSPASAIAAAHNCRERGIKVDCTAIGDANDSLLREICEITGGIFYRAESPILLEEHYAKLETKSYLALEHKS